ncbi:MFS transporter [Acinetobacter sp. WU_MDCI_Axc73]|nr:MFS transporter [Acinetobacter sp. WU_MDCI_Axc73]
MQNLHETEQEKAKRLKKVATATIVGSMLEWYDFYLYATMASIVFSKVFFDKSDPSTASIAAFATFAIGFIARPFGGIFFGFFGDRYGRKKMLYITFLLMGLCTVLIGLIPTYETIGIWAPILLVFFRIIQGLGAGAEFAGAAITSYEHASDEKRGRQGAWPALGLNLGLLLSSLTIFLLTLNGDEFLLNGGWRIPFILSFVLVLVGVWVRKNLPETPDFEQKINDKPKINTQNPFKSLLKANLKGILVVLIVAIGYNALSYIFKTFSLAYLTQFKDVTAHVTSLSITIASLVAIVTVPFFGWLCDYWSSKKVLILGGFLSLLFAYPFMKLLETGQDICIYIAIAIGTGILAPMMFASQSSFLCRQFSVENRSTGVSSSREIGTAIAGGLAPLGALSMVAASPTHSTTSVIVILAVAAVFVVIAAICDQGYRFSKHKN